MQSQVFWVFFLLFFPLFFFLFFFFPFFFFLFLKPHIPSSYWAHHKLCYKKSPGPGGQGRMRRTLPAPAGRLPGRGQLRAGGCSEEPDPAHVPPLRLGETSPQPH